MVPKPVVCVMNGCTSLPTDLTPTKINEPPKSYIYRTVISRKFLERNFRSISRVSWGDKGNKLDRNTSVSFLSSDIY